jgi:bacillithiol biosynthesis deacetylase BshB2
LASERERHVLVVLAHPDDETFGCGGMIALLTRAGVPVTYACGTRGEMGRHMGRPPFANRETLRDLREQELRRACAELGIADLRLLGLWDKTVEFRDREALADRIGAIVAEVRPSLVITSHPQHGGHPDHCAIGAATIRALERLPAAQRPRVHCLINWRTAERLGMPVQTVDIRSVADVKLAAIRAHRSQSEGMLQRAEADPAEAERRRQSMETERYVVYAFPDAAP